MVAEAILMGSLRDNLGLGHVLLWVDPDHRRQGFGSRTLDHIEEHARTRGRSVLRGQARIGEGLEGNRLFAEQKGYTLEMTEIERRLALPVDLAVLDRLAAESAAHHDGYQIRAFVGPVPDELRASYVEVNNLLVVEAPHGDLELEAGRHTVEDLDALDRERAASGRTSATAVAVHEGAVVAYAQVVVGKDRADVEVILLVRLDHLQLQHGQVRERKGEWHSLDPLLQRDTMAKVRLIEEDVHLALVALIREGETAVTMPAEPKTSARTS